MFQKSETETKKMRVFTNENLEPLADSDGKLLGFKSEPNSPVITDYTFINKEILCVNDYILIGDSKEIKGGIDAIFLGTHKKKNKINNIKELMAVLNELLKKNSKLVFLLSYF